MKREVLFRSRWKDTNKVVENFSEEYIIDGCNDDCFIVEQFTGLTDRNGVRIFEGDRLRDDYFDDEIYIEGYVTVVWDLEKGQWAIDNSFKKDGSSFTNLVEYVGLDNLEVLK